VEHEFKSIYTVTMKKQLISFTCLAFSGFVIAGDGQTEEGTGKSVPYYYVVSDAPHKGTAKTEALVVFGFYDEFGKDVLTPVKFSYNGINKTDKAGADNKVSLKTKPGKYVFKFWYNESHYEVTTDSVNLTGGNRLELKVNFHNSKVMMICDKPVIYLYPQQTMKVDVKLELQGNFLFTYPEYGNGWSVTAHPDGSMETGGKTYNYLFWDGEVNLNNVKRSGAFEVPKKDLVAFLEEKLGKMGLNSREIQDFITYWVPRMNANDVNIVSFVFNEDYDAIAKMNISPTPDAIFRVFMIWQKGGGVSDMKHKGQGLPSFRRDGFTVVEWGGGEVKGQVLK
jgi:hypothetical protein